MPREKAVAVLRRHWVLFGTAVGALVVLMLLGSALTISGLDQIAAEYGDDATAYLDATGFPHATRKEVEVYQFINAVPGGAIVTLEIDWAAHTVRPVDRDVRDADLTMWLPSDAHELVTARLDAIRLGEKVSSDKDVALARDLIFRSTVEIAGRAEIADGWWKVRLAAWAARIVTSGEPGFVSA